MKRASLLVLLALAAALQAACGTEVISERSSFDDKYGNMDKNKGMAPGFSGNASPLYGTSGANMPWRGGFKGY